MITRKAEINGVKSLSILFDNYRKFYRQPSDIKGADIFLRDRITNNESVIIIAEDFNRNIMGFVQLYPLFSSTMMKRLWLLNDLFIEPAYRRKGISMALIAACKDLSIRNK